MATPIPPPTPIPQAASASYERQNTNFNAVTVGHINIQVDNIDTGGVPAIAAGSVLEVNGGIYRVTTGAEGVTGSPTNNAVNYIYAIPSGSGDQSTLYFQYSTTDPTWNAAKGGWYSGSSGNRAIVKLFYTDGNYNNKVILDSFNAMMFINTKQTIPTTGGVQVSTGAVNAETLVTLNQPGLYRYELKGGTGGRGGDGGAGSGGYFPGGAGSEGEIKINIFNCIATRYIVLSRGGDGNNGQDGGSGGGGSDPDGGGGGGGGAGGGSSYIVIDGQKFSALGGAGGGGGGGQFTGDGQDDWAGCGGGGGAGYGVGGDGSFHDRTPNAGGKGGSMSDGGAGGISIFGGAGGKGGSYTEAAQNGFQYQSVNINGGIGGGIQGGGGGGGAGAQVGYSAIGGNGGSGLKSTSSGYARIYRVG